MIASKIHSFRASYFHVDALHRFMYRKTSETRCEICLGFWIDAMSCAKLHFSSTKLPKHAFMDIKATIGIYSGTTICPSSHSLLAFTFSLSKASTTSSQSCTTGSHLLHV